MVSNGGGYWTAGKGLETVCRWAQLGLTDKEIAANIGVTVATYRKWKKQNPAFAEAVQNATSLPELELEKSMFDLATGKVYVEEIKSVIDPNTGKILRIEKTKKQLPPNPALQMFLAKSRLSNRYGDNSIDEDGLGNF